MCLVIFVFGVMFGDGEGLGRGCLACWGRGGGGGEGADGLLEGTMASYSAGEDCGHHGCFVLYIGTYGMRECLMVKGFAHGVVRIDYSSLDNRYSSYVHISLIVS